MQRSHWFSILPLDFDSVFFQVFPALPTVPQGAGVPSQAPKLQNLNFLTYTCEPFVTGQGFLGASVGENPQPQLALDSIYFQSQNNVFKCRTRKSYNPSLLASWALGRPDSLVCLGLYLPSVTNIEHVFDCMVPYAPLVKTAACIVIINRSGQTG